MGSPFNIFATAEASDYKFGMHLRFAKAHHKITPKGKSGLGPELGISLIFWGTPVIFLQSLKLATLNLVRGLGLPRAIIKLHPEKKCGRGPGLGKLPKILGFPFNISATDNASDFKFGTRLGFAKANHKITLTEKAGVALS